MGSDQDSVPRQDHDCYETIPQIEGEACPIQFEFQTTLRSHLWTLSAHRIPCIGKRLPRRMILFHVSWLVVMVIIQSNDQASGVQPVCTSTYGTPHPVRLFRLSMAEQMCTPYKSVLFGQEKRSSFGFQNITAIAIIVTVIF